LLLFAFQLHLFSQRSTYKIYEKSAMPQFRRVASVYTYVYISMCVCVCVRVYVCMCVCVYICVCVRMCAQHPCICRSFHMDWVDLFTWILESYLLAVNVRNF
jgi:hypothetical protein